MLASRCSRRTVSQVTRAFGSASRPLPSKVYTDSSIPQDASTTTSPKDISEREKHILDAALRVDQAGEVAANYIYMGQLAVLGKDRVCGPLIQVSCTFRTYTADDAKDLM